MNVYHGLKEKASHHKYYWLNYMRLAELYTPKSAQLDKVIVFTAYAKFAPGSYARHKQYVKVLRHSGVIMNWGKFKNTTRRCNLCGQRYASHEEKETDVNIAIELMKLAYLDEYDTAVVVSADSDLIPAIKCIHDLFPKKRVEVLFPINRYCQELSYTALKSYRIKEKQLRESQFDEVVTLKSGEEVKRPTSWI